jgi:alpha-glucosidase
MLGGQAEKPLRGRNRADPARRWDNFGAVAALVAEMPPRSALVALAAIVTLATAAPARADWRVTSPDGRLSAEVTFADGLRATVERDGARVLSTTIGLEAGERCLPEGWESAGHRTSRIAEDYTTPAGKRREHHHRARQLVLRFRHGRSRLAVAVRAADDGIAYRTTLTGPARRSVTGECSAFTAPRATRAWLQRYGTSYERPYLPTRLRTAAPGDVGFPALLSTGRAWALLSESGLRRGQPAARLHARSGVLHVERPSANRGTPWRVAVIGSLRTIVESDLVDDLAPSARAGDWSWVRPGRVAWSWWSESDSAGSLVRQQQYVDFAARMGWEYVLVDEGWDASWIPALTAYARERGVGVLLWSRWDALATPAQRDALLSQWRDWGVAGVKLDFMQSDSARRMDWYRGVARAAAVRRLVVDFHGSTAPRGLSRTWPNVLTQEAVMGAESYKGEDVHASPVHNATLPFTRNAIGPMDYTPVTFSTPRRATSLAHELALSVAFASGLQHFADSPEAYAAQPLAERWLRDVPAAWDETRLLGGYPGRSATIARRAGERWYVGAIRAGAGGTLELPLSFLPPGRTYRAETIEDAPDGTLAARTESVMAADTLRLTTGADGGYVVRLEPSDR